MSELPRISIVTPSFNQASYLVDTIESVLGQGYPALEYIVIDGGSTDGSADVLRRYGSRLSYWVSERDAGQADAINKGMARATGQIRAYLNSDDVYLPGALHRVARAWLENPGADLFHGDCRVIDEHGKTIGRRRPRLETFEDALDVWGVWWKRRNFVQPEVFWTDRIAQSVGPFDASLHMVMDYDYWTRILRAGGRVVSVDEELAAFRITPTQKSNQSERAAAEILQVCGKLLWDPSCPMGTATRLKLQAQWLYQVKFLAAMKSATARGEPRWKRLLQGAAVAVRHPKLLLAADYRRRLVGAAIPSRPRA